MPVRRSVQDCATRGNPHAVLRAALDQTSEPRTVAQPPHLYSSSVSTSKAHPQDVQRAGLSPAAGGGAAQAPHLLLSSHTFFLTFPFSLLSPPFSLLSPPFSLLSPHFSLLSPHHSKPVYLRDFL